MSKNIIEKPKMGKAKVIAFIIITLLSLIVFFCSDYNNSSEKMTVLIWVITYLLLVILFVKGLFSKFNTRAMGVMKYFLTQQEVNSLLQNEKFKEVNNENLKNKVLFSKKWIIVNGTYIPKNFIIGAYIKVAAYGHYHVNFILINSRTWTIDIGAHRDVLQAFLNKIQIEILHFKLFNRYLDINPGDLKRNLDFCMKNGMSIENLIDDRPECFEYKNDKY